MTESREVWWCQTAGALEDKQCCLEIYPLSDWQPVQILQNWLTYLLTTYLLCDCGCQEVMKSESKVSVTDDEVNGVRLVSSSSSSSSSSTSVAAAAAAVDSHTQLIPLPGPNIEIGSTIDKSVSSSSSSATVSVPACDTAESSDESSTCAKGVLLVSPKLQSPHQQQQQLQQLQQLQQQSGDLESSVPSVVTSHDQLTSVLVMSCTTESRSKQRYC